MYTEIDIREWKKYFMRLQRRVEPKIVRRDRRARKEEDLEEDIDKEEIRRAIKELKDGKAAGIDGILSKT